MSQLTVARATVLYDIKMDAYKFYNLVAVCVLAAVNLQMLFIFILQTRHVPSWNNYFYRCPKVCAAVRHKSYTTRLMTRVTVLLVSMP